MKRKIGYLIIIAMILGVGLYRTILLKPTSTMRWIYLFGESVALSFFLFVFALLLIVYVLLAFCLIDEFLFQVGL